LNTKDIENFTQSLLLQLLLDEAKHWSDRMETLQNRLNTIRMTPGNLLTGWSHMMDTADIDF